MNQYTPFKFWPDTGKDVAERDTPANIFAESFRKEVPVSWQFNPWTGEQRLSCDVKSDRYGQLILPPGETLHAAKPDLEAVTEVGTTLYKYGMISTLDPQFTSSPIERALTMQVGGSHYKNLAIQPAEFCHRNGIGKLEGDVIYYVARWRDKNGVEDLHKARHTLDILIELETAKPVTQQA